MSRKEVKETKEIFKEILDAKSQFDAYGIESTEYNLKVSKKFFDGLETAVKALEQEPCEDCISRKAVLDLVEDMTDQFGVEHRVITEGVISMLPPVTPKPKTDVLDKIRAEIEQEYLAEGHLSDYWDAIDKCLQIVDKYKAEKE